MKVSILRITLGVVAVLAAAAISLFLMLLLAPPPGEGPRAERGKHLGALLISTLENYRRAHGHYPRELAELKDTPPLFEDGLAEVLNGEFRFEYERGQPGYFVEFRYGPDRCRALASSSYPGAWQCSGAY